MDSSWTFVTACSAGSKRTLARSAIVGLTRRSRHASSRLSRQLSLPKSPSSEAGSLATLPPPRHAAARSRGRAPALGSRRPRRRAPSPPAPASAPAGPRGALSSSASGRSGRHRSAVGGPAVRQGQRAARGVDGAGRGGGEGRAGEDGGWGAHSRSVSQERAHGPCERWRDRCGWTGRDRRAPSVARGPVTRRAGPAAT